MTNFKDRIQSIVIKEFPVPPSANALYAYVKNRMVKTAKYRKYEQEVFKWLTVNHDKVREIRSFVKDLSPFVLHVDATFHMKRSDIICLNGKPKRNDTSNRLKALHDVLSMIIIGVDDSYFWSGSFHKVAIRESKDPSVEITLILRPIEPDQQ